MNGRMLVCTVHFAHHLSQASKSLADSVLHQLQTALRNRDARRFTFLSQVIMSDEVIKMDANIREKLGKGLSPAQFIAQMTKNQVDFENWYRRFVWEDDDDRGFFKKFDADDVTCVAIAADWCGDVVRNLPVVLRLMETAGIPTEILVMEEHLETMDRFLTMGGRSIPVVLFVRENGDVVGRWGPRPSYVQEPMIAFKQMHISQEDPQYSETLKETRKEILRRYGDGTEYHKLIVKEIRNILSQI